MHDGNAVHGYKKAAGEVEAAKAYTTKPEHLTLTVCYQACCPGKALPWMLYQACCPEKALPWMLYQACRPEKALPWVLSKACCLGKALTWMLYQALSPCQLQQCNH